MSLSTPFQSRKPYQIDSMLDKSILSQVFATSEEYLCDLCYWLDNNNNNNNNNMKIGPLVTLPFGTRGSGNYASPCISLFPFWRPFSRWIWVSRYQNVSILDFIGITMTEMVSGDNWSYKSRKAPIKSSPPTSSFLQAGWPSCHPINSVKALKGSDSLNMLSVRM